MYQKSILYKILSFYDKMLVFIFCKLFFNRSLEIRKRTIERFGDIEDDTVWQLFWSFDKLPSDSLKAEIFQQILEEIYHSQEFYTSLSLLGSKRNTHSSFERKLLYQYDNEVWKLILYCHVGEAEAEMRFRNLMNFSIEGVEKNSIQKVLADEVGHVSSAFRALKEMGIKDKYIKIELRKIFWKRRLESISMFAKRFGGLFLDGALLMIFFIVGPFVRSTSVRRLKKRESISNGEFKEIKS